MNDSYVYYYLDDDDNPLTNCPKCSNNLTEGSGVDIILSVAGRTIRASSSLLASSGKLLDTEDHAVSNGYHSGTECGNCGLNLSDWETTR